MFFASRYPSFHLHDDVRQVRNYLWRQQYILRFNEDGKKAKSKGNHIWNIEAKKTGDGPNGQTWAFRPFHRRLAGGPPGVAYVDIFIACYIRTRMGILMSFAYVQIRRLEMELVAPHLGPASEQGEHARAVQLAVVAPLAQVDSVR